MARPTDEHRRLEELVGDWTVHCEWFMDPSAPPATSTARESVTMFGPFHVVCEFDCDLFGTPFRGRSTTSYDPRRACYVGTWVDTMNPTAWHFEGTCDPEDRLVMYGEGPTPGGEGTSRFRSIEARPEPGVREFEMAFERPDGSWQTMMRYRYERV
jgi:hypothetical protein